MAFDTISLQLLFRSALLEHPTIILFSATEDRHGLGNAENVLGFEIVMENVRLATAWSSACTGRFPIKSAYPPRVSELGTE